MVTELFEIDAAGKVLLRVHVHPGAGRTAVVGRHGDALKIKVAAPPSGGRANEACAEVVAEVFGVKPAAVSLIGGETSRSKRFAVEGVEGDDVAGLLDRALGSVEHERKRGSRDRF